MEQKPETEQVRILLNKYKGEWRFGIYLLQYWWDTDGNLIETPESPINVWIKGHGFGTDTEAEKYAQKMCADLGWTVERVSYSHRKA